jgi:hydroxyethylthiazole kinase-like sugar kinase family protein
VQTTIDQVDHRAGDCRKVAPSSVSNSFEVGSTSGEKTNFVAVSGAGCGLASAVGSFVHFTIDLVFDFCSPS